MCTRRFQIVWLRCSLFFFFIKSASSLWLRRFKKKKNFTSYPCCFVFSASFSLPQSPNYSLSMCVSSSPFHNLPAASFLGFPLHLFFCFSPTPGPTDLNVLVLISFPDWTHFLSWPYFSWPIPSFLYTCPELFSCQTQNTVIVLWKSFNKAKYWKMKKMTVVFAASLFIYTASGDQSVGASEECTRCWVPCISKNMYLKIKWQMYYFSKFT